MGELMSVLDLLRSTRLTNQPLRVLCDSQYVINCCTRWISAWKKRGWRKADNKPVLNLDLIKALDEELTGRQVTFQWVRGHTGHHLNEMADQLARAAAQAYQQGTPVNFGPGFSTVITTHGSLDIKDDERQRHPPSCDSEQDEQSQRPSLPPTRHAAGKSQHPSLALDELGPVITVEPSTEALLPITGLDLDEIMPDKPYRQLSDTAHVVDITELTRELISDDTQLDRDRLAELMHPDFVAHLPNGLIRTKGSIMARPPTLEGPIQIDVLGADELCDTVMLLRYKLKRNSQEYLCATLWQRTSYGWQARFHQVSSQ